MLSRRSRARIWPKMVFCIFLLTFLRPDPVGAKKDGVRWLIYSEAIEEAQKNGRHIFLYFFSDQCDYCQMMDARTLSSRRVVEYLGDTFVSSRIRAEQSPHLVYKYMVRGFPTSWFLTPEGRAIVYLPGYLAPEEFTKVLRYIGGGHYRSKTLWEYLKGT